MAGLDLQDGVEYGDRLLQPRLLGGRPKSARPVFNPVRTERKKKLSIRTKSRHSKKGSAHKSWKRMNKTQLAEINIKLERLNTRNPYENML